MYCKYISENKVLEFKENYLKIGGNIVANPTEEHLKEAGYKLLIDTEMPQYNEEREYLREIYTEYEDRIEKIFVVEGIKDDYFEACN